MASCTRARRRRRLYGALAAETLLLGLGFRADELYGGGELLRRCACG